MARFYHIDIARHAAAADAKWIDNLLSRHTLPGVDGGRQGQARRLSVDGIYHVALVRKLAHDLGLRVADAVLLAADLLTLAEDSVALSSGLQLRLDRPAFRREIDLAIADAVESIEPARRGRPPGRTRRTASIAPGQHGA